MKKGFVAIIGIFSLALIILTAGEVINYSLWKKTTAINDGLQNQQAQWQSQINSLSSDLSEQKSLTQNLQNQFAQLVKGQQQTLAVQTLNEIAYLLDLANLYLQINHDPQNAIKSLLLAQTRLKDLNDPRLVTLKQAIASDLNALNDIPVVDIADILLKLQTLSESISRLSFTNPVEKTAPPQSNSAPSNNSKQVWYKKSAQKLWDKFKSLFVIQYNSAPQQIIAPDQRELIRENISVIMAQAQWAVLKQNTNLYQQSLNQVQKWLTEYFPKNVEKEPLLARLSELMGIKIAPDLPDLNNSLAEIQKAVKEFEVNPSLIAPSSQTTPPANQPQQTNPPQTGPTVPVNKNTPPPGGIEI